MTQEYKIPQPYSDIMAAICLKDKLYFEQHPSDKEYTRLYVSGELGFFLDNDITPITVTVHKISDSVRAREMKAGR